MTHKLIIFLLVLFISACTATPSGRYEGTDMPSIGYGQPNMVDRVVVKKSINKLYLMKGRKVHKAYNIGLGRNPVGHKVQEGDHRTPEGRYYLNYKNENSKFYRSLNITYPNERDIARAKRRGVDPGDDIVLHGMPNELGNITRPITPKNWTQGCIAVRNHEMDEIWSLVALDTPIDIYP
jgi:murein L,D-transpeptidase YafK